MKLAVITAAHKPYSGALMERSARRVGIEVFRFAEYQEWPKDYRVGKLIDGARSIAGLPANVTHVMGTDSSDTLFLASGEQIVHTYEAIRDGYEEPFVLISAEKNCYPKPELAPQFVARARTPWHFLNSGAWITRREEAEAAMLEAAGYAEYCDQLCWSLAHLAQKLSLTVHLDQECCVFQSMYLADPDELSVSSGRLYNRTTWTWPCHAHWNGTRNAGSPSRDGVWACLGIAPRLQAVKEEAA